jgi:hypothetical protein
MKALGFKKSCLAYYESQDKNLVINFNNLPLTEEQKKWVKGRMNIIYS